MGMSAKAKALLTGEKTSEWNKYQVSMQDAYNDLQAEQTQSQQSMKSKSGKAKFWGGVAFLAVAAIGVATGGFGAAAMAGLTKGTAAYVGFGAATAAAAGGVAGYGAGAATLANIKDVGFGKSKEEIMGDIYDPKFGKGTADTEKLKMSGIIDEDIKALDMYEEGGALDQILYENIGRTSSYIGATTGG